FLRPTPPRSASGGLMCSPCCVLRARRSACGRSPARRGCIPTPRGSTWMRWWTLAWPPGRPGLGQCRAGRAWPTRRWRAAGPSRGWPPPWRRSGSPRKPRLMGRGTSSACGSARSARWRKATRMSCASCTLASCRARLTRCEHRSPRTGSSRSPSPASASHTWRPGRIQDGPRVLVDRVWPRGLRKDAALLDEWAKDVAPSTGLRTWYGHDPAKFDEFRRRYIAELAEGAPHAALGRLHALAAAGPVTLLTATRDIGHSQAAVLAPLLRRGVGNQAPPGQEDPAGNR